MKKPAATQIDRRARAYRALCARLEPIQKRIDRDKAQLITLCRSFGHSPLNAEKTLRLEGVEFKIDAGFGQSVSIDEDRVARIAKIVPPKIFGLLFETRVSHAIAPGALNLIEMLRLRDGALRRRLGAGRARRVCDLFAKIQVVTPRAPTLNVKPRTKKTSTVDGRRSMAGGRK